MLLGPVDLLGLKFEIRHLLYVLFFGIEKHKITTAEPPLSGHPLKRTPLKDGQEILSRMNS